MTIFQSIGADVVDADRAQRGRSAGEVKDGEVVRVLAEAYLGTLEYEEGR